jgi:hypothetical protein
VSAFGRHVIDDENADHDADQQRRPKNIFHFIDPFALQSRTIHATEKFVGVGMRPSLLAWQLTFHGPELINPARDAILKLDPRTPPRPNSLTPSEIGPNPNLPNLPADAGQSAGTSTASVTKGRALPGLFQFPDDDPAPSEI